MLISDTVHLLGYLIIDHLCAVFASLSSCLLKFKGSLRGYKLVSHASPSQERRVWTGCAIVVVAAESNYMYCATLTQGGQIIMGMYKLYTIIFQKAQSHISTVLLASII